MFAKIQKTKKHFNADIPGKAIEGQYRKKSVNSQQTRIMSRDIFGLAFQDFIEGDLGASILVEIDMGEQDMIPVAYFFRDYESMPEKERMVMDACHGRVLDVGAGAGAHAEVLAERGLEVVALDLSPGAIEIMRLKGLNAVRQDFFHYHEKGFDTILFLMNGAGIAGKLSGLKKMLQHARSLLNPGGEIFLESTDLIYMYQEEDKSYRIPFHDRYYGEVIFQLSYKGQEGKPFPWLFVDYDSLKETARECGLHTELIYVGENHSYMARLYAEEDNT